MGGLAGAVRDLEVPSGRVGCVWLGQAGFLFKTGSGRLVMIDPYLSDRCADLMGLHRKFRPPLQPEDLTPDVLLVTHLHDDHLDEPVLRAYAGSAPVLVAPLSCLERARAWGWPTGALVPAFGQGLALGLQVMPTFARHPGVPDAVGYLLDLDGVRLWHSGDTEYDAHLRRLDGERIDVALMVINGGGGNMNTHEAALLAWQLRPRLSVPMHYGMWPDEEYRYNGEAPDATPDPALFEATLERLDPGLATRRLRVGRPVLLP
jgi:L-ascorbate 6-phosphate lactonase